MVKFAHLADCHLGGWKIPEMESLSLATFEKAIEACVDEKVDFVLIAGDFFDNALPSIDTLKLAALKLKELKEKGIRCYIIAGSHDYSASGKTFLDVLENAGLCKNVSNNSEGDLNIIEDTDVIIAGISGKKVGMEQEVIRGLNSPDLSKFGNKLKILMLHTTIAGSEPNDMMKSIGASEIPGGFDYYALGHIHKVFNRNIDGKLIVYPGPLYPNNFSELEELGNGKFVIAEYSDGKVIVELQNILLRETKTIEINAEGKGPEIVTSEIMGAMKKDGIAERIILLRVAGTLSRGKTSDVDFNEIKKEFERQKGHCLLRNISKLESPEFKTSVKVEASNMEDIEKEVINKNQPLVKTDFDGLMMELLKGFDIEKMEGETSSTFESRLREGISRILGIGEMI
ncbi:MAG: exonuclease SbcCD subunit D [Nanoarchaeota archaeon]|nr:exonuclease SbcCD subunit D [Nanoarchaeota archaeon]